MHSHSDAAGEPFVAVNCAALPSMLLESELFGHVKGAFTGAHESRRGRFALAGRGSIVLDEIVAIPLCFFWLIVAVPGVTPAGSLPTVENLWQLSGPIGLPWTVGIFAAFRLFDIWKPWPVRPTQGLPGGWGVTVDDLMAAGYVNLAAWIFSAICGAKH